ARVSITNGARGQRRQWGQDQERRGDQRAPEDRTLGETSADGHEVESVQCPHQRPAVQAPSAIDWCNQPGPRAHSAATRSCSASNVRLRSSSMKLCSTAALAIVKTSSDPHANARAQRRYSSTSVVPNSGGSSLPRLTASPAAIILGNGCSAKL